MMDQPSDEKIESYDIIQDEGITYHDKCPIEKTNTLPNEKDNDFNEVQSNNRKTLKDQDICVQLSHPGKNYITEVTDVQIVSTDGETKKNQETEVISIDKENSQVIETKIIEEINTEKTQILSNKSYDSKPILEIMKHEKIKGTENTCTGGNTTNTNTVIIDLCDDDTIEICEQIDSKNVPASGIDFKSNNERDSTNKLTQETMEYKKVEENVTASDSKPLDTIIIDLCDDQIEMYEQNDGFIQSDRRLDLLEKEEGQFSGDMPGGLMTNPKDSEGKIKPIQILKTTIRDDIEKEAQMKDITKAELKTNKITQKDESKKPCELPVEDEPEESYQTPGADIHEKPSEVILKCHTRGVDPHYSDIEKNVNLTENYENVRSCFEEKCVKIEENHEASINANSDGTEMEKKNEECDIENFRFKDDIITLQEDYGMDSKQVNKGYFHYLVKSDMVPEDCKFTVLDESNQEEKRCDKILRCGYKNNSGPNALISEITLRDSKVQEQETTSKLKTEETKHKESIEHGQALKLGLNEPDFDLTLIKKEIEEDLKRFGGKDNTQSATEKDKNSSMQTEKNSEQGQHEDSIAFPLTFTNILARVIKSRISDNSKQLIEREYLKNELEKEKNKLNINNAEMVESCNKKVISEISLDITCLKKDDHNVKSKLKDTFGFSIKDRNSKFCQTEKTKDANENSAGGFLNDTPPSISDSDSNEEFYDAVEYISEAIATKETHPIKKERATLLSTPKMNLIDESIPGPSGVSKKRNEDQISDEILKTKEIRKHNDMEDDEGNENQKKIKLD